MAINIFNIKNITGSKAMNIIIRLFVLILIGFSNNALAYSACKTSSHTNESKPAKYSTMLNLTCLYENGNSDQKLTLARKYFTGHMIEKNLYLAIRLYKKAILEGNIEATTELADLYLSNDMNYYLTKKNISLEKRKEKAFILYSISAFNNDSNASKKLEVLKKEFDKEIIEKEFIPIVVKWINNKEKRKEIYSRI